MRKSKKLIITLVVGSILLSSAFIALPSQVLATSDMWTDIVSPNLEIFVSQGVYPEYTEEDHPAQIVALIIKIILSFLAIIFVALIIYGGFTWMTATGNQERVTKSKDIILNSIIGIAIVIAAYAISFFVLQQLVNATS